MKGNESIRLRTIVMAEIKKAKYILPFIDYIRSEEIR